MDYINAPIDLAALPQIEQVPLQPIHRDYLKILRYEWLFATAIIAAIAALLIIFNDAVRNGWWWVLLIAITIVFSAVYFFVQERSFPYRAFAVREKDVIYRKGWILQSTTICPFNRIQNCSVQSGPWERKFGLASLIIYTAGTEGADLRIPGLQQDEAEKLRHFILDKINAEEADEKL